MQQATRSDVHADWRSVLLDRVVLSLFLLSIAMFAMLLLDGRGRAPAWMPVATGTLFGSLGVVYALRRRIEYRRRTLLVTLILLAVSSYASWAVGYSPGLPLLYAIAGMVAALCHSAVAGILVFAYAVVSVWALNAAVHRFGYVPPLAAQVLGPSYPFVWIRMSLAFTVLSGVAIGIAASAASLLERHLLAIGRGVAELEQQIERRKQAEAQREQALAELLKRQKFELAARFSARVAHDFNNALTIILACTEQLRRLLSPGHASAMVELDAIERTAKSAADVSRSLLVQTRGAPSVMRAVRLDQFLAEAARMIERALPATIGLQLDAREVPPVLVDPYRLDQALLNLVFNARDAMPGGGRLWVRTFAGDAATRVALEVMDSGCGMDVQIRTRLFEPFFTTKPERGTGLGLCSVQAIIAEAGGTVEVRSEPGRGSAFTLWFPPIAAPACEPAPPPLAPIAQLAQRGAGVILLVEDEPILRKAFASYLATAGYEVVTARNGDEALEVLTRQPGRFALLLTDGSMPGAPVRVVIERFKQHNPGARYVICSGYVSDELLALASHGGQVLQKPFREDALLAVVRGSIEVATPRSPLAIGSAG